MLNCVKSVKEKILLSMKETFDKCATYLALGVKGIHVKIKFQILKSFCKGHIP